MTQFKLLKISTQAIAILIVAAIYVGCAKSNLEEPFQTISYQWKGLDYNNKVILINSNEELEKYIDSVDADRPVVDFSKHSLLLASGQANANVIKMHTTLIKKLNNNYTLKVEITLGVYNTMDNWDIGIITPNIPKKANINLDVQVIKPSLDLF